MAHYEYDPWGDYLQGPTTPMAAWEIYVECSPAGYGGRDWNRVRGRYVPPPSSPPSIHPLAGGGGGVGLYLDTDSGIDVCSLHGPFRKV